MDEPSRGARAPLPESRPAPRRLMDVIADDITTTYPDRPLEAVIADVVEGFAVRRAAFLARNPDERAYLESEDDHTIWEGPRLLAAIRAAPGGEPEVTRLDETRPDEARPAGGLTDDEFDLRSLPWDITDRAIGRWSEARKERDQAYRVAEDHAEMERWTNLATVAVLDAERLLISAILAWSDDFRGLRASRPTKWPWPPRGVLSCGKLYLAIPDPGREGEKGGDEIDMMHLAVVEMASVVDMGDCPDIASLKG